MTRNKPRLQLALYARLKHPGTYHYALFVSPKSYQARTVTKHHVKNALQNVSGEAKQPWCYECATVDDVRSELRLLVRVAIAKITSVDRLGEVLQDVPIYQVDDPDQTCARSFDCQSWVRAAVAALNEANLLTGLGEWEMVETRSLDYLAKKKKEGRWNAGQADETEIPLLDLMSDKEVVV